jgi:hypothetical protein
MLYRVNTDEYTNIIRVKRNQLSVLDRNRHDVDYGLHNALNTTLFKDNPQGFNYPPGPCQDRR